MAKRIVSEDTVQADTRSGTQSVSEAKIYLPNYREVNQILMEAPGSASISFNDVLSRASMQMLQTQERVYQGMERDALMSDVNTKYQIKLEEFNEQNPSGRGFTEYATQTYNQLIQEAADNAQTAEVSQEIRALGYANMKGIANSAVQQENKRFVAYATSEAQKHLEIKYNQIQNDPDRFEGLSAEATATINNLDGVIPASKLAEFREHTKQNLFMSYGMGLVRKNPDQAGDFLKNDLFASNLSHENYNKLINFAEQKKKDKEKHDHRLKMEMLTQQNRDSGIEKERIKGAIERDEIGLADIEANTTLTPLHKQQAINSYEEKNREIRLQEQADEKMDVILSEGRDISTIEEKYQKKRYEKTIRAKQAELQGESDITGNPRTITSVDKVIIAKDFSYTNIDLRDELYSKMTQSSNFNERINAAYALKYAMSTSPRTLGTVNQRYINFANEVVRYVSVDPSNKEKIVENAAARYLDESKNIDNKLIAQKISEVLKNTLAKVDNFIKNYDFNGRWWHGLEVIDKAQFQADMVTEIDNTIRGGATVTGDILDNAAANLKNYWKESGGKMMRNPPELMNPALSEFALKNTIASGVKSAVGRLIGVQYAGAKFELVDEVIKSAKRPSDFYTQDLTTTTKPVVKVTNGDEVLNVEVQLESIALRPGLYKMYCEMPDGSRRYIPSAKNPLLQATVRIGANE